MAMKNINRLNRGTYILATIIMTLSVISLLINYYYQNYAFIIYYSDNVFSLLPIATTCYIGCLIALGKNSNFSKACLYLIAYLLCIIVLMCATVAAEVTPYTPIDQYLVAIDRMLGFHTTQLLAFTHSLPLFNSLMQYSYSFVSFELSYIPLVLILFGYYRGMERLFFVLLFTALCGFIFYYFWPSTAPASVINSPYFMEQQRATGLKFHQIHSYQKITTIEGGMVAMPSFHVIWAWTVQYASKDWRLLWWALLPYNILLTLATLFLGWHYLVDVLGSIAILSIAYKLCHQLGNRRFKPSNNTNTKDMNSDST